jgi:hypothetical protein
VGERELSIEIEGLQGVLDSLSRISRGLDDVVLDESVMGVLLTDANRRAPVLSGALRASGHAGKGTVIYGSASVPYAHPIHWGWPARNIVGQPWLEDAMNDEQTQQRMVAAAERMAQKLIDEEEA